MTNADVLEEHLIRCIAVLSAWKVNAYYKTNHQVYPLSKPEAYQPMAERSLYSEHNSFSRIIVYRADACVGN